MTSGLAKVLLVGAALLAPVILSGVSPRAEAARSCIDVALVLAVDSSASVSPGEYRLQQQGIAAAFRNDSVVHAMAQAGRVAVSVVFWGSEGQTKPQSAWVMIDGKQSAEQFARIVESMPRQVTGDTGLASGLMTAVAKLASLESCSLRKIVNVSGDGEETRALRGESRSAAPKQVRDLAEKLKVEINALAISNKQPGLARYYTDNVITGPDAFVMEVHNYAGFSEALRRKLIREISPRVVSQLPSQPAGPGRIN